MKRNTKSIGLISIAILAGFEFSGVAIADPLSNEQAKFDQQPLINLPIGGVTYNGHDELSTAYLTPNPDGTTTYQGKFMADDFADQLSSPVVHLSWWGSYLQNPSNKPVSAFLISFESDVPADATGGFSHPGQPLRSQIVKLGVLAAGSGTFTESPPVAPSVDGPVFKYNAELNLGQAFPEKADTVYWLKIVALTDDRELQWGWHDRNYAITDPLASTKVVPGEHQIAGLPIWHFQDDAVAGDIVITPSTAGAGLILDETQMSPTNYLDNIDGPVGISNFSKDLAFTLYTPVPEPSCATMLGAAMLILGHRRRRIRR